MQNSFKAGQISEKLAFHTEFEEYRHGASEITNMLVSKEGSLTRRPGFVKDRILEVAAQDTDVTYMDAITFSPSEHYEVSFPTNTGEIEVWDVEASDSFDVLEGHFLTTTEKARVALQNYGNLGRWQRVQDGLDVIYVNTSGYFPPLLLRQHPVGYIHSITGEYTTGKGFTLQTWEE